MIGELRFAVRLLARSVAKVRFYVAEERAWPEDPAALDAVDDDGNPLHDLNPQLVADALHNFARIPFATDPDGFTARLAENLAVVGEAWVHIDDTDTFRVRSISEVTATADGRVTLATLPGATSGSVRHIQPDTEELLRCWVPDPEWGELADAPMRSLLDVAEDAVLAGREQRAAARSRLAANGILFISESMSLVRARTDDDDDDGGDTFMRDLTEAMLAPISDDGDPQMVVPVVVRANPEDIEKAHHMSLERADSKELIGRQSTALLRLLRGLDIQPEQVDGIGSGNHWCVDEQTEALTTQGWVGQAELRPGDVVLTLNHETGLSEWQPVLDVYRATVTDEPMVSIEGRRHSSLTTTGHRWPVRTPHGAGWTTSGSLFAETTTTFRRADEVRDRRERAVALHAGGWKYRAIGDELGVSEAMARQYVNRPGIGERGISPRARDKGNAGKFMTLAAPHADLPVQPKYEDALVELVAWFFTEGSAADRPGRRVPKVTIYQSYVVNPDNVARIRRALTSLFGPESAQLDKGGRYATPESVACRARARSLHSEGWRTAEIATELDVSTVMVGKYLRQDAKPGPQGPRWRERRTQTGMSHFVLNTDAARVILDHAPARVVAHEFVTALTAAQLELFLDTAIRGDGCRQARGTGTPVIGQKDPAMLDAMETAAILAGYSVMRYTTTGEGRSATGPRIRTQHCLSFTDRPLRTKYAPQARSVTEAGYTGTVWCPTTPNGTWCARRRGTVYFTGNSSWAVEAKSIRDQVQPAAETLAACMAQAFLRPALISLGHPEPDVDRVTIAVDVSPLSENPNRGQDARDAHAAFAISDDALREALGFGADDAPDETEMVRRLASSGRLPVDVTAAVLGLRTDTPPRRTVEGETVPVRELPAADRERPAASPGETVPSRPVPEAPDLARGPAGPVVAAAAPDDDWRVEVATALGDIDAALLDRITTAADAAIARVVEKAGARVRSAAQKDRAVVASLSGVEVHLIASTLGRDRVSAFVPIDDLITDAYTRLKGQVRGWLTDAATATADVVVALLRVGKATVRGRKVHATVTARLTARTDDALRVLDEVLDQAAERALFAPDPFAPDSDLPGEGGGTLIRAGEVRSVLDTAGGGNGGVGTGDTVARAIGDEGGVILGYEWNYRPEIVRSSPFPPHVALHGVRFATFTDPKLDTDPKTSWLGAYFSPGDHENCMCAAHPVVAFPELDDGVVARRLREAAGDPRNLLVGRIAADDDRAGRVGTSLQNEVEVRTRITTAIERLQREHIERAGD